MGYRPELASSRLKFSDVNIYYSHAAEVSSILAQNPELSEGLRRLITGNQNIAEQFLESGSVFVDRNVTQNVIKFLHKLQQAGKAKLKADIDSVLKGIKDGDLLKGVVFFE